MIRFTEQIAIPDFSAGAMENWGLISYGEGALLYEEGVSSTADMEWIARVISHELAHQVQSQAFTIINSMTCTQAVREAGNVLYSVLPTCFPFSYS